MTATRTGFGFNKVLYWTVLLSLMWAGAIATTVASAVVGDWKYLAGWMMAGMFTILGSFCQFVLADYLLTAMTKTRSGHGMRALVCLLFFMRWALIGVSLVLATLYDSALSPYAVVACVALSPILTLGLGLTAFGRQKRRGGAQGAVGSL